VPRLNSKGIALAVIVISFLSAGYLFTYHKQEVENSTPEIKSTQVLTWDCEFPEFKPETIMIYCGDGGAYVDKIRWDSWSPKGASGAGEYYKNLCKPDCADGEIVHAPVKVELSDLTLRKAKYYLRTLDISSSDGKDFSWGEVGTFHWDVMEFAEQMSWD
jgi:hypothetical protein